MAKVFGWPPVGVSARYWTPELPVGRSQSLITGGRYVSAAQRRRLTAGMDVPGRRHYASGYLEALWRLMDGGVHLVRLTSCRIPWGATVANTLRGGNWIDWQTPPDDIPWEVPPGEILWFEGVVLSFTIPAISGLPAVQISGLPPSALVAIPGEFVTIFADADDVTGTQIMIAAPARSDASGVAVIRLVSEPPAGERISIGWTETGVFEISGDWPQARRRAGSHDEYAVEFRQVFEDETDGFEEVPFWWT